MGKLLKKDLIAIVLTMQTKMPADNAEAFEIRKLNSKSVGSDSDKKVEFGVVQ